MNINQTLKLQCRYSGDPNIRQDWYLKGKSLVDGYAKTSRGKYVLYKQIQLVCRINAPGEQSGVFIL